MIRIEIPGKETLTLHHLVLDYNGTIAVDGILLKSAQERIQALRSLLTVHILTADTYGTVVSQCEPLGIHVETFPREDAAKCKEAIIKKLGGGVCALGNGFNDIQMFDAADLSIAILEEEGLCTSLLPHADILVRSITAGLDLLLKPDRIKANLRS